MGNGMLSSETITLDTGCVGCTESQKPGSQETAPATFCSSGIANSDVLGLAARLHALLPRRFVAMRKSRECLTFPCACTFTIVS